MKAQKNESRKAFLHALQKASERFEDVYGKTYRFNVNMPFGGAGGRSLFAEAAFYGRVDIMKVLSDMGATINLRKPLFKRNRNGTLTPMTYGGYTPLHYAAMNGETDAVAWLLGHGVKPFGTVGNTGIILEVNEGVSPPSPLRLALPHPNTLRVLAAAVDPESLGTELCEAIYERHVDSVKVLLEQPGINVNVACDDDGRTPLYIAGRIAYYADSKKDVALREKAETMFRHLLKAHSNISFIVEDEFIEPEEENEMTIEEHALKGHFTLACLQAMVEQKQANAYRRRRHLLSTRRRPVAKRASSSKSNTRRKSRSTE